MALETSPESPAAVRTVSRLMAEYIGRLGPVWIDGQVAEFKPRPGARVHFLTLRDPDADMSITVAADPRVLGAVEPPLAPGQRVVVQAQAEYWTGRGSLQFRAKEIRPVGIGELLAQLERLRGVLTAEGLFAPERKKPLPFIPRRVGLICGRNSAAMHDVLVNAADRWPAVDFEVREVAVQGAQAVTAVTGALAELAAMPAVGDSELRRNQDAARRMRTTIRHGIDRAAGELTHLTAHLRSLSPQSTMDRGYAIVATDDGTIVREPADAPEGTSLLIRVAGGRITATSGTTKGST